MKRRLTLSALSICGLAISLAAPVAIAADVEPAMLSACLASDQQIVKAAFGTTPASPCSATETEVRWMVDRALPEPAMTSGLVEGIPLAAREEEPGVFRVAADGVRDVRHVEDVVAGLDGSIWVFWNDRFSKLGGPTTHRWSNDLFDTGQDSSEDIEVGPDGVVWWADPNGAGLQSFDGSDWTVRRAPPRTGMVDQVEVLGDGTVIASWWLGGRGDERRKIARLDGDRWRILDSVPGSADARLGVSEDGDVSVYLADASGKPRLFRGSLSTDGGSSLQEVELPVGRVVYADTGSDGTTWLHLERDPRRCGPDDCMVRERQVLARLADGVWAEFGFPAGLGGIGGLMTAPDGSVWSATCDWFDAVAISGCELLRFDGEAWSRFLGSKGYGDIDEIAFAADGSVWSVSGPNDLFVVKPEALAEAR